MKKLRLREVVCPRLRSWGKIEPGLKSRPGGLQGPSLFHDTTQLLEVGWRLRIVSPDCQMQTDFAEAIPKQVLLFSVLGSTREAMSPWGHTATSWPLEDTAQVLNSATLNFIHSFG